MCKTVPVMESWEKNQTKKSRETGQEGESVCGLQKNKSQHTGLWNELVNLYALASVRLVLSGCF